MATATTATIWSNATDAGFRAWGSWLSAQLTAFGWTLVGSVFATGTNWTDVTAPAAANTARVTELWRMNDAAQATAPLFMLIEYGETSTADVPGIRIRFGTGGTAPTTLVGQFYDTGAGYLGGNLTNANSMTHYASGDAGRFGVSFVVSGTSWSANSILGFGIERRKNNAGADQTTGWLFYTYGGTANRRTIGWKADGSSALGATALTSMCFPVAHSIEANLTFDLKQMVAPLVFPGLGPMEIGLGMVCAPAAAFGPGATYACDIMGASHTFLAINDIGAQSILAGAVAAAEPAMRYE